MFYLRQRTRVSGPFTGDQIKAMLHRGRIARSDKVSTDRETWRSIAETPELIARPQPAEPVRDEVGGTASVADARLWYYTLGGAQQQIAVDTTSLAQLVATGRVGSGEMVWTEGFSTWQPVGTVPAFAAALGPAASPQFPLPGDFPPPDAFLPPQADEFMDLPFDFPDGPQDRKGWL